MNGPALNAFREAVVQLWWRVLRRRSQGNHLTWRRMGAYVARWLPTPRICHPYPLVRFGVLTQGRSRMRYAARPDPRMGLWVYHDSYCE